MKKKLKFLSLMLALVLPAMGLAAEAAVPSLEESTPELTEPFGMGRGRAWRWPSSQADMPSGWKHARQFQVPPVPPASDDSSPPRAGAYGWWRWAAGAPHGFIDENKDGLCDVCGMEPGTHGRSPAFEDADGDGICDNLGTFQQRQGPPMTRGGQRHGLSGRGNFRNRGFGNGFRR